MCSLVSDFHSRVRPKKVQRTEGHGHRLRGNVGHDLREAGFPQCSNLTKSAAAPAAISVLRKLTASLLRMPLRSNAAPRRLSAIIPRTADRVTIQNHCQVRRPTARQTKLMAVAARTPAIVPGKLMPPSVPAGTSSQVVISTARSLEACPYSLETVSAAASPSAAANATMKIGALVMP